MTRSPASESAPLDRAIVAALAASGPMTVAVLRERLGVRRQRLLEAIARLRAMGAVVAETRRAKAKDRKIRNLVVYALVPRRQEPSSQRPEPGSLRGGQVAVAPDRQRRRGQCPACGTIWAGRGWCPDCVLVEGPRP